MFLLFHFFFFLNKQTHKYSRSYCTSLSFNAGRQAFSSPKLFLWTQYCAHWCFFLSLHACDLASVHILSLELVLVVTAPLSNLWPEGGLVPLNTHRIPSNHPSLICEIDCFQKQLWKVAKVIKGNYSVSSDQNIYGELFDIVANGKMI